MSLSAGTVQARQQMPYPGRGYARGPKSRISKSVAFKAPMCTLFNMSPGPPVGTPLSVRAPLESIKGRARTLEQRFTLTPPSLTDTLKLPQALISNTTHSGHKVLCSGGLNHSKSLCAFRVLSPLDQASLDFPQTHPRLKLGRCIPPPGWRFPPTFGALGRGHRFG
jgi:hypothetical protein